jgi:hypothetical protein
LYHFPVGCLYRLNHMFFPFFHYAVNLFTSYDRLHASVVRQAFGLTQIPRSPSIDQVWFPNEGPTHGDVIGISAIHQALGHLECPDSSHQDQWNTKPFLKGLSLVPIVCLLFLGLTPPPERREYPGDDGTPVKGGREKLVQEIWCDMAIWKNMENGNFP